MTEGILDNLSSILENDEKLKKSLFYNVVKYDNVYDNFLFLTPDEIIDIVLSKKDIYSTAVHFGPLICQPKSRCLNYNPLYEKDRFCVQIKWYSLNDDIIEFMNNEVINRVKNNERIDKFLND